MVAGKFSSSAVRRLLKDFQEIQENPLPNVVAEPLQENLFEWHANIRTEETEVERNPLAGVAFHLALIFPADFPNVSPEVRLSTPLPHPNVFIMNYLHLATREPFQVLVWDCIAGFNCWTSAYTVRSVLLQVQTFLSAEDDVLSDAEKMEALRIAALQARQHVCRRCGHTPTDWRPKFLTPDVILAIALHKKSLLGSPEYGSNDEIDIFRCFHSKKTHEEDVLGFPVSSTVNPRTGAVSRIHVHLNVLSRSSFKAGIRTTIDNEDFNLFLPLYITANHFRRALPLIQKVVTKLCSDSDTFVPEMVVELMPKILNSMVVLLCEKGFRARVQAIEGYCLVHHLFVALCDNFNLWRVASGDIDRFRSSSSARMKAMCPDLGHLMARLSVCSSGATAWHNIVGPLTAEMFYRSVWGICKQDPSLVERFERATSRVADDVLLRGTWEGMKVDLWQFIFHNAFLHLVAHPRARSVQQKLPRSSEDADSLFGMPSPAIKRRLLDLVTSTIEIEYDWPRVFYLMGLQCYPTEHFTGWLGECWTRSVLRYHSENTKFQTSIQRTYEPVTTLREGETYRLPSTLNRARLLHTWCYTVPELVQYLDVSCLVYDNDGCFIEAVDSLTKCSSDSSVIHCGSRIDLEKRLGTHTIDIDFRRLASYVQALFFVFSGFAGATLNGFELLKAEIKDLNSNMVLCRCTLESDRENLKFHQSVVLCCIYKTKWRKHSWKWDMDAIGCLGPGFVGTYVPLQETIQRLILAS